MIVADRQSYTVSAATDGGEIVAVTINALSGGGDLHSGDLRALSDFAFFRNRYPLPLRLIGCANADFWRRPGEGVRG
jgi:hypothetical protein